MAMVFVLTSFGLSYAEEDNIVLVPAGEFIFGPPGSEKNVYLKSYFIDKYEVTVGQFKKFVKATGYVTSAEKLGYTFDGRAKYHGYTWKDTHYKYYYDNYPVTCLSAADAEARMGEIVYWVYLLTHGRKWAGGRRKCLRPLSQIEKKRGKGVAEDSWISGQTVSPLQKGTARLPLILCFFHVWDSGRVATIGRLLPFPGAETEWP